MKTLLILGILAVGPAQEEAPFYRTLGGVVRIYESENVSDRTTCYSYLVSHVQAVELIQELFLGNNVLCVPRAATNDQLARVFLRYATERPENFHEYPTDYVFAAFSTAFPCPE